ncbi:MAG: serine/threonine-protein kinase [Acidobacteria bacterium]|nr:serine/threonine-protein kinase [Acidobacteriota bacterium]MCB9378855.1 serine/threonine-protein kinase [Holophagales bacterium]
MIGKKLGPYEITAKLGEGGMGEVFRARDTKLDRDVAVKVLPTAFVEDSERLQRFEREAKLLAQLNHPNIAQIYGMEASGESHALVMELVEGPTLAERLESGALPIDEALSLARQIAEALEEAHEKGIVHRDLKPQNIKAPIEGKVKILDFGLAKAVDPSGAASGSAPASQLAASPTLTVGATVQGVILGTAAYMAPEQARGGAVDKRADVWAFGVVLYEMLTGESLFAEGSVIDTLSAVMRKPIDLDRLATDLPPRLRDLVARCLERDPRRRLRDIGEARIALEDPRVAEKPLPSDSPIAPTVRRRWVLPLAALGAAVLAAAVTALLLGRSEGEGPGSPEFQQLTFQRGTITAARFAPDPDTVVYSAAWGGRPSEVFTTRRAGPGSRSLGLTDASLLAVSKQGELAVKLHPRLWSGLFHGTLGRVPLGGGAPRQVAENVQEADWSGDGKSLFVVRKESESFRWIVEDSTGRTLYGSDNVKLVGVRASPDGKRLALVAFAMGGGTPSIVLLDAGGESRPLADAPASGLAWSPSGDEVWYSQWDAGGASSIWAVDFATGRKRLLLRHAGSLTLHDIAADGTLLVSVDHEQRSVYYHSPASPGERDLAWLDGTEVWDLSADGGRLLLAEKGTAEGPSGGVYLRDADGSPPIRLGDGNVLSLSPDGDWALVEQEGRNLVLVPTGAGQARKLPVDGIPGQAWFFPDGSRLVVNVNRPDGRIEILSMALDGSDARPLVPAGFDNFIGEHPLSPDGRWIDAQRGVPGGVELQLFPTDGSLRAQDVRGFEPDDAVIRWSADGRALFVFKRNELPARVFRLDLETGERTPWLELMPADAAGVSRIPTVQMTPDGRTYAYNVARRLSDLYLVRGVK